VSELRGLGDLLKNLDKSIERIKDAADVAVYEAGADIADKAQAEVPRVTGRLANSAFVTEPRDCAVTVGYGVEYAAEVHEEPESDGHKWFEQSVNASASGFAQRIRERTARALASGEQLPGPRYSTRPTEG